MAGRKENCEKKKHNKTHKQKRFQKRLYFAESTVSPPSSPRLPPLEREAKESLQKTRGECLNERTRDESTREVSAGGVLESFSLFVIGSLGIDLQQEQSGDSFAPSRHARQQVAQERKGGRF